MKIFKYVIALLVILMLSHTVVAEEITKIGKNRFGTNTTKLTSSVASGKIVSITSAENLSGKLTIKATESNQATFAFYKTLKTASKSDAIEYARVINVVLEETTNGVNLILQAPNPAPWSGTDNSGVISGELEIPKNSKININAQYFDLKITGPFGAVENTSSFGRAEIEGISGVLNLATTNQDIIVNNINGEVNLSTSHADIELNNIVSSERPANIQNENGTVTGDNLSGIFDIKNSFGRIRLSGITLLSDKSRISGSYCSINLRINGINKGGLTVRNTNEDIKVFVPESLAAEFSLRVDNNGEIDVEGLEIKPMLVEHSRLDFETKDGGPRIRMSVRGDGNISIRGN
ncbi:MAG: hypothetical protein GY865_12750 [candidate division Zixibacteria bacterium]|nr:hypothetical protein [candidate division Zixibacteria bacterium]